MVEIVDVPKQKIGCIRNLWEKLNQLHYDDSVYFEDHYVSFTFEKRVAAFADIEDANLKISVVKDGPRFLGYCVSSIEGLHGEIDSLYLEEELRGRGIGKRLVEAHIAWMKGRGCDRVRLAVSYGHDSVREFYHRMGFFERLVYYELKDE
jgi:GNAT superfamily N-acetyltransferase